MALFLAGAITIFIFKICFPIAKNSPGAFDAAWIEQKKKENICLDFSH